MAIWLLLSAVCVVLAVVMVRRSMAVSLAALGALGGPGLGSRFVSFLVGEAPRGLDLGSRSAVWFQWQLVARQWLYLGLAVLFSLLYRQAASSLELLGGWLMLGLGLAWRVAGPAPDCPHSYTPNIVAAWREARDAYYSMARRLDDEAGL